MIDERWERLNSLRAEQSRLQEQRHALARQVAVLIAERESHAKRLAEINRMIRNLQQDLARPRQQTERTRPPAGRRQ